MEDKSPIINYYDEHIVGKINGFIQGNRRVETAFKTIIEYTPLGVKNVLEIGCGIGDNLFVMSKQFPNASFTGLDISPKSIEAATKLFGSNRIKFVNGTLQAAKFDKKFDIIILMDVYEHISNEERKSFNDVLATLLSDEGKIMLMFPTPRHLAYLRANIPSEIQPVDEDITSKTMVELGADTGTELSFYKEVAVWNQGDYAHAVLSKPFRTWPASDKTGININKVFKKIILQNNILSQKTMRKSFVNLRLGTSFTAK